MHTQHSKNMIALPSSQPRTLLSHRSRTRESLRPRTCSSHRRISKPPSRAKYTAALRLEHAKLRRCAQHLNSHFKYVDSHGVLRDASRQCLRKHQTQLRRLRAELAQKEAVHAETVHRLQLLRLQSAEGDVHKCVELAMGRRGALALGGLCSVQALRQRVAVLEKVLTYEHCRETEEEHEIRWELAFLRELGEQFIELMETEAMVVGQKAGEWSNDCARKACEGFLEVLKTTQSEGLKVLKLKTEELDDAVVAIVKRRDDEQMAVEQTQERIEKLKKAFERDVAEWEQVRIGEVKRRRESRAVNARRGKLRMMGGGRVVKAVGKGALARRAALAEKA